MVARLVYNLWMTKFRTEKAYSSCNSLPFPRQNGPSYNLSSMCMMLYVQSKVDNRRRAVKRYEIQYPKIKKGVDEGVMLRKAPLKVPHNTHLNLRARRQKKKNKLSMPTKANERQGV